MFFGNLQAETVRMLSPYTDTHCNVPNVLKALSVDPKEVQDWVTLTSSFPVPSGHKSTLGACISVSSDLESHTDTLELLKCQNVYGAFGIHPLYAYEVHRHENCPFSHLPSTKKENN